ncbi:hypothetical protein ElyMa_000678500 [Elysia marginata]|uniref:Uncharacterized protein n=1 Tax=Elysia marginata TaxID=1093978 RepID=A0AAV4GIC4_9GAST|nr:hypothetical protein ElyMa_000678500 [Elysia marginata]
MVIVVLVVKVVVVVVVVVVIVIIVLVVVVVVLVVVVSVDEVVVVESLSHLDLYNRSDSNYCRIPGLSPALLLVVFLSAPLNAKRNSAKGGTAYISICPTSRSHALYSQ